MWDLAQGADSRAAIEGALSAGRSVALISHAPAVLVNATSPTGAPIVKGRKVTSITNEEENAVGLTDVVPFLLEDVLKEQGWLQKRGAGVGSPIQFCSSDLDL